MNDSVRKMAAVAIIGVAAAVHHFEKTPSPDVAPAGKLDLKWQGSTAQEDRLLVGGLTAEIADVIEYDGTLEKPRLSAGVHVDELRTRARDFRCKGENIRDRQPAVNKAVEEFLDKAVGNSGGPLSEQQRKAWVDAYREIARSCGVSK
jgi:hypothetical protein